MDIVVSQEQGRVPVTVFHLKGDLTSVEQLKAHAQEALDAGTSSLLLDLTEVPYISSRGLQALHHLYMLLRSQSPDDSDEAAKAGMLAGTYKSPHLKLLNPSKSATKALSLAGYDMFLEVHHDLKMAVASF
jgi:hypothetical protein